MGNSLQTFVAHIRVIEWVHSREWREWMRLPSEYVNGQNEPSCGGTKREWRGNQWSICPWTVNSECGPLSSKRATKLQTHLHEPLQNFHMFPIIAVWQTPYFDCVLWVYGPCFGLWDGWSGGGGFDHPWGTVRQASLSAVSAPHVGPSCKPNCPAPECTNPDPSTLACLVKKKEDHQNKGCSLAEPLNPWKSKENTPKRARNVAKRKKATNPTKQGFLLVPSDTKLLLTKNYSEIIIFGQNYESHA